MPVNLEACHTIGSPEACLHRSICAPETGLPFVAVRYPERVKFWVGAGLVFEVLSESDVCVTVPMFSVCPAYAAA